MEEAVAIRTERDVAAERESVIETKQRRSLSSKEVAYMQGDVQPALSSVLISNSKYLNDPYFRDTFAQFGLRKAADDLPATYMIPQMVRALAEVRDDVEFFDLVQEERARKPEFAAWLDRRRLTTHVPAEMRHYSDGTLGATVRDFIENSGMEMQFMRGGLEPKNDLEYMIKRRNAHHDIEHMVTGFGPNALGETALAVMNNVAIIQYFSAPLAKYLNEANMFITATGIFRQSLHVPELLPHTYEAWRLAITAGQSIKKPLIMVDWEDYLDWQIDDIAKDLGFERGPGAGWEWSSRVAGGKPYDG